MANLAQERLSIAVAAVAAAGGARTWTLDYVKERTAFGQPIGRFQNTKFVLADVKTQVDVAQAYVDQCVLAHERRHALAGGRREAKLFCTELQKR